MTIQSSKASFFSTRFSKTTQLRRLSLVLLSLTASVGMSAFQVQSAIAAPNSNSSTATHLLAEASTTTTNNAEQAAALLGYQLKAGQKALGSDVSISTLNKKLCGKAQSHVSSS